MAAIRKIAIFGSTGMSGRCVLETALKKGLDVTVLVRDPARLPEGSADKVRVVQGDVTNPDDVDKTVEGQEAIVIILGTRNNLEPTIMMSEGTKAILSSMKKYGVERVSACMSAFLFWEKSKVPERFVHINGEHEKMLEMLKGCDRSWTAVLPPHIEDAPSSGVPYLVKHDSSPGRKVSKHDLGEFMVECLSMDCHKGKVVGITSPPPAE